METGSKILIIGQSEMIKSALLNRLNSGGFSNVKVSDSLEPDEKPDYIFFTEWVGGIMANVKFPAEMMYNLTNLEMNVIEDARKAGVKKMLFLARSCVYPKDCPQPMKEEHILTGELDASTEPSAIATLWGIKMCQFYNRQYGTNFIVAVPTGVYGPKDDFDLQTAHVLPALIRRFHEAKVASSPSVILWGSGNPRREWLYVDDLADALVFLMENYDNLEVINIGVGDDLRIKDMADVISKIVRYEGKIAYDISKPDGAMRKRLDNSKLKKLGWEPKILFTEGINRTYDWFCKEGMSL
ncbi:MAG: GDP-L-fucose synthase [Dehalococcoidales bacterium]|nr:GDP-L-fucose synthase [Dehalococcoidales bacterium]